MKANQINRKMYFILFAIIFISQNAVAQENPPKAKSSLILENLSGLAYGPSYGFADLTTGLSLQFGRFFDVGVRLSGMNAPILSGAYQIFAGFDLGFLRVGYFGGGSGLAISTSLDFLSPNSTYNIENQPISYTTFFHGAYFQIDFAEISFEMNFPMFEKDAAIIPFARLNSVLLFNDNYYAGMKNASDVFPISGNGFYPSIELGVIVRLIFSESNTE